jgi:hypothetical protein
MSFTIDKTEVITYSPSAMASFPVYAFEWIDNLHFVLPPDRFLQNPSAHIEAARTAFLQAGWDGDGEIGLLWLPPFAFPLDSRPSWIGVTLWHVKQIEDGISWLLSPIELPFDRFAKYLIGADVSVDGGT